MQLFHTLLVVDSEVLDAVVDNALEEEEAARRFGTHALEVVLEAVCYPQVAATSCEEAALDEDAEAVHLCKNPLSRCRSCLHLTPYPEAILGHVLAEAALKALLKAVHCNQPAATTFVFC